MRFSKGVVALLIATMFIMFGCSDEGPDDGGPGPDDGGSGLRLTKLNIDNATGLAITTGSVSGPLYKGFNPLTDVSGNLLFKISDAGAFEAAYGIQVTVETNSDGVVTETTTTNQVSKPVAVYNAKGTDYLILLFKFATYEVYLINKTTGQATFLDASIGVPYISDVMGPGPSRAKYDIIQTDSSSNIYFDSVSGEGHDQVMGPHHIIKLDVSDISNITKTVVHSEMGGYGSFIVDEDGNVAYYTMQDHISEIKEVGYTNSPISIDSQFWLGDDGFFDCGTNYDGVSIDHGFTNFACTNTLTNIETLPDPDVTNIYTNILTDNYQEYIYVISNLNIGSSPTFYAVTTNEKHEDLYVSHVDYDTAYKINSGSKATVIGITGVQQYLPVEQSDEVWGGEGYPGWRYHGWNSYGMPYVQNVTIPIDFNWKVTNELLYYNRLYGGDDDRLKIHAAASGADIYISGYGNNVVTNGCYDGEVDNARMTMVRMDSGGNFTVITGLEDTKLYKDILFSVDGDGNILFSAEKENGKFDIGNIPAGTAAATITDADKSVTISAIEGF